jgi:hypothetical protein
LGAEMVPLGRYIVVAEQHQASLLAGHGVSEREALAAAVAAIGEAERDESKSQSKLVPLRQSGMAVSHAPVSLARSNHFWVAGSTAPKIPRDICSLAAARFSRALFRS